MPERTFPPALYPLLMMFGALLLTGAVYAYYWIKPRVRAWYRRTSMDGLLTESYPNDQIAEPPQENGPERPPLSVERMPPYQTPALADEIDKASFAQAIARMPVKAPERPAAARDEHELTETRPEVEAFLQQSLAEQPAVWQELAATPVQHRPLVVARSHERDWLDTLLDTLHLLFIGHTRGGKTSIVHELVQRLVQRGEKVLVCDLDAAPGLWTGCEVHGYGDDFHAIERALQALRREVSGRRAARGRGQRRFSPLYVFIDEYQDVGRSPDCPTCRPLVESILRRGGKLNVHLIIGIQDKNVKSMGFEGQGSLRENFTYIVEVRQDREDGQRWAKLTDPTSDQPGASYEVPVLPDIESLVQVQVSNVSEPLQEAGGQAVQSSRKTRRLLESEIEPVRELDEVPELAEMLSSYQFNEPVQDGVPDTDAVRDDSTISDDELVRELVRRNLSANEICKIVKGTRADVLEKVRRIRETFDNSVPA